MVQKIKEEKPTTDEESGSDSDVPSTPLAASTQLKSERQDDESGSGSSSGEDSEDYQPATQERIVSPEPDTLSGGGASMEKYLSKFPFVRPSKPKYSVDVDLTDPDDEVWIIQCPASMDAKKVLQSAKFEDCRFGQATKIKSSHKGQQQIEGLVVENTNRKPVVILSGKEFKSFVPQGTIQIRESLAANSIKQESIHIPEDEDDSVPYPENLRDRHPLLGLDYKSSLKLPKKVKKSLSLAQQRAEASYLESPAQEEKPSSLSSPSKKNKRKRRDSEEEMLLAVADIKQELSDVVPSPARKKVKKEKKDKAVKAATAVEDDLSWLHNIVNEEKNRISSATCFDSCPIELPYTLTGKSQLCSGKKRRNRNLWRNSQLP